jgi:subtilase family serine protease
MKKIQQVLRQAAMWLGFAVLFMALAAQAESRPILTAHVPEAVSSGVAPLVGQLPADRRLSLAISLPLRNASQLDDLLNQLYDPRSPSFHRYLSVSEFAARFAPAPADYAAVRSFAKANGLTVTGSAENRMVLDVEGPASSIETAFHVTLGVYQHPTESRTFYAPDREPTADLHVPLLHISGLDDFSLPRAKNLRSSQPGGAAREASGSGPEGSYIGSDLRAAYYGSGPLQGQGQTIGLFEYAGYELSDVKNYFAAVKQPLGVSVHGEAVNGARLSCPAASCDDAEQSLDIETAISMAPGLEKIIVYVGNLSISIFNKIASDDTAKQISCSWGWNDNEKTLDPILKELSAQGQTVFVATGDNGSGTPGDVVWPADDPYVVAVGGTDLITAGPGGAWKSETGWSGSAGSPSKNNVPIPRYQQLAGVINSRNHGSTQLRNYPDVAAEANTNLFSCFDGSCSEGNGGTSYAAPQWAGIMAMVNQQSIASGGTTLGFINPALYAMGTGTGYDSDFHDILSGSNGGYNAVQGYDLVTGWGSPNGTDFIQGLLAAAE